MYSVGWVQNVCCEIYETRRINHEMACTSAAMLFGIASLTIVPLTQSQESRLVVAG